ncbi:MULTISPECIES: hypothetical protein [unclassified Roseovarius]|uniref:hypothetical protein n=1 Tax=unclassified Roseovarius TaxID=2614913 RepID=UPI00273ED3C6|nr:MULTISPECIES: hypothetical protein [unclassified Roseovarius]
MKRTLKSYLKFYGKRPLLTSLVGIFLLFLAMAVVGIIFELLKKMVPLNPDILIFVTLPLWLLLLLPMCLVVFLSAELMWRTFGVYKIIGVEGEPVREYFRQLSGDLNDE